MTFDTDIWHAGSHCPYLGQVRRSKVIGQSSRAQEENNKSETVGMVYSGW